MPVKKEPPAGSSKETRDCWDNCGNAYDACMKNATSDAQQWACNKAYETCVLKCDVKK